jgi:outer membrane protein TolC
MKNRTRSKSTPALAVWAANLSLATLILSWTGCAARRSAVDFADSCAPCRTSFQEIECPQLACESDTSGDDLLAAEPITLSNFSAAQSREISLDECVEMALANSKVMQKLGGVVVASPQAATTLFDQAIFASSGVGVEAALSQFDAQVSGSFTYNRSERKFNNPFFGGGASSLITNASNFNFQVSKQTASGASFAARTITDYNRSTAPINLFPSAYDIVNQVEIRQALGRGSGTLVNRIAGPNAQLGSYNGVMIGRIRSDISLADFETAVRDLVRDVENNYWELYFAYRDLDTKISARDASRATWENRQLRYENEVGRPDDEAQARQQYYNFKNQAQNALAGVAGGQPGVLGAERNLRRLLGLPTSDGTLMRPTTEPTVAPVAYDWGQSQMNALDRRVEIRRQKWTLRQRELELIAAKALNRWQFDMVGQYGFRGFGDNLFGSRSRETGSAFDDLINGDLDDWQLGVELNGAIGKRRGHLAVRNAELYLVRERALLKEQQRQILHDLNAAYTEVDRALVAVKTSYNSRIAIQEEIEPKRKRVAEGQDQVFFLLDAEQRLASSESAVHRAIADYNKALASYEYACGNMLGRFNIQLAEGPWHEGAVANMNRKVGRFRQSGSASVDTQPVTRGPHQQGDIDSQFTGEVITSEVEELAPQEVFSPLAKVESNGFEVR